MRYGGGIIAWKKDELQNLDRRTRKLMTMNIELNLKSDVSKHYVCRKDDEEVLQALKVVLWPKKTILLGMLDIKLKIYA